MRTCVTCGRPRENQAPNARYCAECQRARRNAALKVYRAKNPEQAKRWQRSAHAKRRLDPVYVESRRRYHQEQRAADPELYRRRSRLSRHGLDEATFQEMWDRQRGCCALCDRPFPVTAEERYARREPQVDHAHDTGRVRGLLCRVCNTRLGAVENLTPEWWRRLPGYLGGHDRPEDAVNAIARLVG